MLEEPNTIRKERNIKRNNEAAVWHDALLTEDARNDWIAKEGGVVKDECKLRFVAELALVNIFIENEAANHNEREHDDDAAGETFEEEVGSFLAKLAWESDEKRGWHEDREQQINEALVGLRINEFCFAKNKTEHQNDGDGAEA